MAMTWSTDLAVDVPEIDGHHKTLMAISNELELAHERGQGSTVLGSILCRLSDFANYHFALEEHHLRILKCPDYEAHRAEHDRLLQQLGNLVHAYECGDAHVTDDTLAFLRTWLVIHIQKYDRNSLSRTPAPLAA